IRSCAAGTADPEESVMVPLSVARASCARQGIAIHSKDSVIGTNEAPLFTRVIAGDYIVCRQPGEPNPGECQAKAKPPAKIPLRVTKIHQSPISSRHRSWYWFAPSLDPYSPC